MSATLPPRYDDLELRVVATFLCLGLALRRWWPVAFGRFYLAYSYITGTYCLAFMLALTSLNNQGDALSLVNMVIGAVCIILMADWRNAAVMLATGYGLSTVAFWAFQSHSVFPSDVLIWLPAPVLVFLTGVLSQMSERQVRLERHRLYLSFAGSIAHEMRCPMQKIQHVFDTLERDFMRMGPSQTSVTHSREQILKMTNVLNEGRNAIKLGLQSVTLTLQQLKTKAFDTSGFTLLSAGACTERAVSGFCYESHAQRGRVRLEEVGDFTFKGDETVLTLVLFNLLKNALCDLSSFPHATVTVTVEPRRITVRDTGPGIAPEKMARLFEDFQTSRKAEGTGLGLAFCRRVMRAFGGDIACDSQLGAFTQFTLTFPEVPPAQAKAHAEECQRQAAYLLRGARLLLVDGDPLQRRSTLLKLFSLVGNTSIDEAADGAQAIDLLRSASVPYDLVVMDIDMPMLDGCDAVRQIRWGEAPGHEHVPVLAHTAQAPAKARALARESGMDGFVTKPCSLAELAGAIVNVLKEQPRLEQAQDPAPFKGRTALLAEDNAVNRAILKDYLEMLGLDVMEASQGQEVLQCLKAGVRPSVILMDVEMPVLDGWEATRQLRSMNDGVRQIPVVALTAHSSADDRQLARDAGMDGFLTKPVNEVALRDELARVMGRHTPGDARPSAAQPSPSPQALSSAPGALLDIERIEMLKQMNIMADLLPDGLAQCRHYVSQLHEAVRLDDLHAAYHALHSLTGLSGQMGARALFETARQHARVVETHAWPAEANWLEKFTSLADDTERALQASFAAGGRLQL